MNRGALKRARVRRKVLRALPEVELDELAYARVERKLFEPKPEPRRSAWIPALGLGFVAAAVALFLLVPRTKAPAVAPVAVAPPTAPARALVPAATVLAQGEVELRHGGVWGPLTLDSQVEEGDAIRTGDGRAAIAFTSGRGAVLEARGVLELERLRQGEVELALGQGQVSCAVAPLRSDERFHVHAGPRWVRVVGTAFSVTRLEGLVRVEVEHGTVAVSDAPEGAPVRVSGPGRLEAPDGTPIGALAATAADGAVLRARSAWTWAGGRPDSAARLDVGRLPAGAQVRLDGAEWGPAPLLAWVLPGEHRIGAHVPGEPDREISVTLQAGGAPYQAVFPRVAPRRAPIDPAIVQAVSAQHHEFLYCYDHALKRNPTLAGQLVLRFTLEHGAVQSVETKMESGAPLPADLGDCIDQAARALQFPATAPAELVLPLNLQAK